MPRLDWKNSGEALNMDDTTYEKFENIRITTKMLDINFSQVGDATDSFRYESYNKVKFGIYRWELVFDTSLDYVIDFIYDQSYRIYEIVAWEFNENWEWQEREDTKNTKDVLQHLYDVIITCIKSRDA